MLVPNSQLALVGGIVLSEVVIVLFIINAVPKPLIKELASKFHLISSHKNN
jgi:hypothetical protein